MTNQKQALKIVLVGDCLSGGGAEKVHALLSVYLYDQGFEVHNCIFYNWISYDFKGTLLNLGTIVPKSNFIIKKIKRFLVFRRFIAHNNFDIIIDFRMRDKILLELLLAKTAYPKNVFYTVHSAILEFYFPKSSFLSRIIYQNHQIVTVSKAIEKEVIHRNYSKNTITIYNPIDLNQINELKNEFNISEPQYVLAVGRMNTDIKQFDKLIKSYSESNLPTKNIKLIILGTGILQFDYKKLVTGLNLNNYVIFKDFTTNPYPYYKNAFFTVLCSKNEGFPNVLLESLACETPIVAFDCFSGPSEIIINKFNGLLVDNQNFKALTIAMNKMITDKNLYANCKEGANKSITNFNIEAIGQQWVSIFKTKIK